MRVAVVIPMWNQLELTQRCLRSVAALKRPADQVIVVDNGSADNARNGLQASWPDVVVERLECNRGFAGGCNAGIRRALAEGADAVLLLNNDAIAAPTLLDELLAVLNQHQRIAAVGAKTLTDESPPRIHAAYGVVTFHGSLVRVEGWLEPSIDKFSQTRDVDSVSGAAMLLRRSALAAIGLFDEDFFAYHEDVDWCARARRYGWRIRYAPAGLVYHRMHASTGGGYVSPITYLIARNSVLFVRKNASARQKATFAVYTLGNLLKEAVYRCRMRELAGYRLRLRGLRDGLLGRPVPLRALGLSASPSTEGSSAAK
ncbi:MAG: glycosyltransferase family 2 protein [Deltaproteobacteria bacterium]|nr:glycosyltransferase family 2 protein [Deltaproteobacteria bacterium]